MIRVTYDPNNGVIFPDAHVEAFVEVSVSMYNKHPELFSDEVPYIIVVGNGLILEFFRKYLAEGKFDKMEVQFEDKIISVNENGSLAKWPKGLNDIHHKVLVDIMTARRSKTPKK